MQIENKGKIELSERVLSLAEKFAQEQPPKSEYMSPEDMRIYEDAGAAYVDASKEIGEKIKKQRYIVRNTMLYHPRGLEGLQRGKRIFTNAVEFDWGSYAGKHSSEPYYILQPRTELGDIQVKGDPFTYEKVGDKLRVISGPESMATSIGRIIKDFRVPPSSKPEERQSEQLAKVAPPTESDSSMQQKRDEYKKKKDAYKKKLKDELENAYIDLMEKLSKAPRRTNPISGEGEIQYMESILVEDALNEAREADDKYNHIYEQRNFFLTYIPSALPQFNRLIRAMNDLTEAKATNYRQDSDAADGAVLASDVNEIVKNASLNAVFWSKNIKTPFGR